MVDRGEGGNVADQLVEQGRLQQVGFLGNQWLLSEHNILGRCRICGEKTPVDEASIPRRTQRIKIGLSIL